MHVYARFHCICPCPVPGKGCLGWHSFARSCVVQDIAWQTMTMSSYMTSSAMHLTCSTCSTCSPPCKTGHVCFLAGAVVWNTQPAAESSVQRQAHILSYLIQVFDIFMAVTASIPSRDILGSWRALTGKTTWPVVFAVNIWQVPQPWRNGCHQHPPAVWFLTVRSVSTICVVMIYQCWSWFGSAKYIKICQCCQRARFDDIWLLELILEESKDQ